MCCFCIAVTVTGSVSIGQRSGGQLIPRGLDRREVADPQGSAPDAEHSRHSGNATTDTVRRHHRAPRQPATSTAAATPDRPTQIHSECGAGSPASPSEATYQYAATARATPMIAAHGSHTTASAGSANRSPQSAADGDELHCDRNPAVHQQQVMPERFEQCHANIVVPNPWGSL